MSIELKIPKTGMGITEGTVQAWHKSDGDAISKGEHLVDIETAKAIEEIESPIDGILEKILLAEGESAEVDTVIALLSTSR